MQLDVQHVIQQCTVVQRLKFNHAFFNVGWVNAASRLVTSWFNASDVDAFWDCSLIPTPHDYQYDSKKVPAAFRPRGEITAY